MEKESPCNKVCIIDPKTSLCLGCGRTSAEISAWLQMSPPERRSTMAMLPQRMLDAGLALPEQIKP